MTNLAALTTKRREHVKSCEKNSDNSHKLIAGMYSDQPHFVYELLQNADDAKASKVKFILRPKSLEFHHNGKLFDFDDVESITTINDSTKKEDVNAIGTFGAGFKSVFAITKTPSIHSGKYHFRIVDVIVPEEIERLDRKKKHTVISIPFNHRDRSCKDAYKQIYNRLKSLEFESLLFLRNIREIEWRAESKNGCYLVKIKDDKISLICSRNNQDDSQRDYLIFKDTIEIESTKEIENIKLDIAVAYLLNTDGNAIVPVQDSKLFVFFPTELRTGLKFLVHAPYKTTPNRESIPPDDSQNKMITKKLSMLIAESIQLIKDKGLLDVGFLSLLPIDSEKKEPQLYASAFKKVKKALTANQLLPTASGRYANAKNVLLAREKELTSLLGSADCNNLFDRKSWLSTEITADKTKELRGYLTEILEVPEVTMEKFCRVITREFIENKLDKWIIKFYSNRRKSTALYDVLRERPIIRLENGAHICPENEDGEVQVYLPSEINSNLKTVKKSIAENKRACEFLKNLGIDKPDDVAEIKEFIVPKYKSDDIKIGKNKYLQDFKNALDIWLRVDKYKKQEVEDLLKEIQFIRCINQSKSVSYQKPGDVYFPTAELLVWFQGNPDDDIYFIHEIPLTENSKKFLGNLGAHNNLKMDGADDVRVHYYGRYERSVDGFNPGFYIYGLEYAVENITVEKSILLWSVLFKHPNKLKGYVETKTNQNNPYDKGDEKTSRAMDALNEFPWLYGTDGELIKSPINQITVDDLNADYRKENSERLVKALGLKLDITARLEEETGKNVLLLSDEEKEEYEEFKEHKRAQNNDTNENTEEQDKISKIDPEDCEYRPLVLPKYKTADLSGQDIKENAVAEKKGNENSNKPHNSKAIGDYGEKVAKRYLKKKYPTQKVVWLNENRNNGKGYDFVIRENGEDIAYFEVKSTTDPMPRIFQMSGTQWGWATKLHNDKKGDRYIILLVSNVGKEKVGCKEIPNPVALWQAGELGADPVNIKLW